MTCHAADNKAYIFGFNGFLKLVNGVNVDVGELSKRLDCSIISYNMGFACLFFGGFNEFV